MRMTVVRGFSSSRDQTHTRQLARRRVYTLVGAGLLLVYALSSFTTDNSGRAPTQRNWVYSRLDREHTVGQTFVVERDELVAVRVLLFADSTKRDDPVTLRLHYAEDTLPDLAKVTLPLHALAHRELTTFAFPPLTLIFPPNAVTTTLRLDLEAPTLTEDWITVMAGPDTYPSGELFIDDRARPAVDLAFQPIYRRRWLDTLLPITRMASGKPGLFGWPPLYALLAYGYAMVLVYALRRLWRIIDAC